MHNNIFFTGITKNDREKIIKDADDLLNGYVSFNNNFDMERCDKKYRIPKDYRKSPNRDGEWVYQYVRLEHLKKLLIAFDFSKNNQYLNKYCEYIDRFYSFYNKKVDKKTYVLPFLKYLHKIQHKFHLKFIKYPINRPLDSVIRCYEILICLEKYNNYFSPEFINNATSYVINDLRRIPISFDAFFETSNWGVMVLSLKICCCLILRDYDSVGCLQNKLVCYLDKQIKKDGGHIENSFMYHSLILLNVLRCIHWSKKREYQLSQQIFDACKKMLNYSFHICDNQGIQIQYGDSDANNLNTLHYIGAKILECNMINLYNPRSDTMLFWEFCDSINFNSDKQKYIRAKDFVFDSGVALVNRGHFSVFFFNETSYSSHNHADNCELVLYYHDIPILIDGGRFTYLNGDKRRYYRGPLCHNIAVIDRGKVWETKYPNHFNEVPCNCVTDLKYINGFVHVFGKYEFKNDKSLMQRDLFVSDDFIIIVDTSKKKGKHTMSSIFNFDSKIRIEKINNLTFKINSDLFIKTFAKVAEHCKSRISRLYNIETNSTRSIYSSPFNSFGFQVTIIFKKNYNFLNFCSSNNSFSVSFNDKRTLHFNYSENGWKIKKI